MDTTTDRVAVVKRAAEDLAVRLLENGLVTDDPQLVPTCAKLKPFQDKLGGVDRGLIQKGLALVSVDPGIDDEAAAKTCLVHLVEKLDGMKWMFGIF